VALRSFLLLFSGRALYFARTPNADHIMQRMRRQSAEPRMKGNPEGKQSVRGPGPPDL
jgi:hypothetical protein